MKVIIKKYVIDEYKAGTQSEKLLKKAEDLVFSYARTVYSDDQLEHMKNDFLRQNGF